MTEIVKKITVKGIVGEKIERPEKARPVAHIYGTVNAMKPGQTQYGNFVRFIGRFEGVNLETGDVTASGALILPGIAENLLAGAISADQAEAVDFAFEVGVKPSKSPVGYDFTVRSLIEHRGADPLAAIRHEMETMRSLPSPEKAATRKK